MTTFQTVAELEQFITERLRQGYADVGLDPDTGKLAAAPAALPKPPALSAEEDERVEAALALESELLSAAADLEIAEGGLREVLAGATLSQAAEAQTTTAGNHFGRRVIQQVIDRFPDGVVETAEQAAEIIEAVRQEVFQFCRENHVENYADLADADAFQAAIDADEGAGPAGDDDNSIFSEKNTARARATMRETYARVRGESPATLASEQDRYDGLVECDENCGLSVMQDEIAKSREPGHDASKSAFDRVDNEAVSKIFEDLYAATDAAEPDPSQLVQLSPDNRPSDAFLDDMSRDRAARGESEYPPEMMQSRKAEQERWRKLGGSN